MTVETLANKLDLTVVAGKEGLNRDIEGGFIGDLLSIVMAKAKKGDFWVTIQSHVNIIAVASLTEVACIILAENYKYDADTIAKADEEGICILKTPLSAYEVTKAIIGITEER